MAGALACDFRNIDPKSARVVLIDSGGCVLPRFPPVLSRNAQATLEALGVEVRLGQTVIECDLNGVMLKSEWLSARTILWAAGVMASPAAHWLVVTPDHIGRVPVGPQLNVAGLDNVFVIGYTAHTQRKPGTPLPGVAPVARQQGKYVAELLTARARGHKFRRPFRHSDCGRLATIGRKAAVADFGLVRLTGFLAWTLWSVAHIYFIVGYSNRFSVAAKWLWAYITFQHGVRLSLVMNAATPTLKDLPQTIDCLTRPAGTP
jgi:NADH dehydrogenase